MENYCTFYIVRHGEAEGNALGLIMGQSDYALTEAGRKQAKNLAKTFQHVHFDAVFSSDLLRAKQTAEIVALERKLAVNTNRLLRERKFGDYEGKKRGVFQEENKKLLARLKSLSFEESKRVRFAPNIENDEEINVRLVAFIQEIAVAYPGKTILVVTHGGIMRALLQHLRHKMGEDVIQNTAYFRLRSDGTTFSVEETSKIKRSFEKD